MLVLLRFPSMRKDSQFPCFGHLSLLYILRVSLGKVDCVYHLTKEMSVILFLASMTYLLLVWLHQNSFD